MDHVARKGHLDLYSVRGLERSELGGSHRPVIKIGPKGALGSHKIRPIHTAPSLGQSIAPAPNSTIS